MPRFRVPLLAAATALALAGCGGDDDGDSAEKEPSTETATTPTQTATTPARQDGAGSGEKDTPTFEEVRRLALREIGKCPRQKVRQQISRAGQEQRGIEEFPALHCDGVPVLFYVRYEDDAAREADRAPIVEIPFFVNRNVLVTALLTTSERIRETLPGKIRDACGCGEVQQPGGS